MAIFTIKRGDTAPPLEIALSIAGGGDGAYWNASTDKPDGASTREIREVRFIMKNTSNDIVGAVSPLNYTGIGYFRTENGRTILGYTWNNNDTAVQGAYKAEFEVIYQSATGGMGKKRTFPCTPGDVLMVNVDADLND